MRIVVDEKADALYVYFGDRRPARTVFVDEEQATLVDLGPGGELLGIEVIYLRRDWTGQLDRILAQYPIGEGEAAQLRVLAGPNHPDSSRGECRLRSRRSRHMSRFGITWSLYENTPGFGGCADV